MALHAPSKSTNNIKHFVGHHKGKLAAGILGTGAVVGGSAIYLVKKLKAKQMQLDFIQERLMYIDGLLKQLDYKHDLTLNKIQENLNLIMVRSNTVEIFK
jgi:hypothetical protein